MEPPRGAGRLLLAVGIALSADRKARADGRWTRWWQQSASRALNGATD